MRIYSQDFLQPEKSEWSKPSISQVEYSPSKFEYEEKDILDESIFGTVKLLIFQSGDLKNRIENMSNFINETNNPMKFIPNFNKTKDLLKNILFTLWNENVEIFAPKILVDEDSAFTLRWKTENFLLSLYLFPDESNIVHIYGKRKNHPEDTLDVKTNFIDIISVVVPWVKRIRKSMKRSPRITF